ncbi:AzlD domain-containing protein [Alisedimentitalea sp. MJ-SS2]|uniref:AzlD domain-containing protein n=1 Tax=Aliisedimentitalea sp. MJ-SS2 TaxID=3049795 RepID=UPI00290B1597|nr:AzlD domain-containing protein [Alisedimentitalea sp. MJ-SS2]MDU8927055.1 AzlD domain-containing protein [Alisedimentitalea sp. MJ-SS2]
MISQSLFWTVTILLGIGTFLIRFSFLGLLGDRELPEWVSAHLRYTAVAIFPALVTPLVLWPDVTGGEFDPKRLVAALAVFLVGLKFNTVFAIIAGMGTLYFLRYFWG